MLDEKLIAAYRATDYVLFDADGTEVTLNVGVPNPAFDRILAARGAATAVVVTAYNPRSVVLPEAENRNRHGALVALIEARGYDYAVGEGRDPTGHWKAEVECIVFVAKGGAPELLYPD